MNLRILHPITNKYSQLAFQKRETNPIQKENKLERNPNSDSFELSVGYINDLHGQTNNMMRILSGIKGDVIFSAGDNDIGDEKNRKVHDATVTFLNLAKVNATALGNHEMDTTQTDLKETVEKFNGKIFAVNLKQDLDAIENNDDKCNLRNFIKKSDVIEVNGEKIGVIGAAPIDLSERWTHPDYHEDVEVSELNETIESVQAEVDKLKAQGINKIFLLSHLGLERDKELISQVDGIDVIIGGHTHELIDGIEEDKNLFYSKSGEPVIVTEAGKDGKYFGQLNLTFDKNGVITKAQNNLGETNKFHRSLIHQNIFNEILGTPEVVGVIKDAPPPPKSLLEENAHANFMCDAMRVEMDAEIGLWNNCGTRNYFKPGIIDTSDVKDIAPFADNISVADVSEKTLVDAFRKLIETSFNSIGNKPGLMAVSGLNYTVSLSEKTLVGMNFVDKDGIEHPIDVNNPREDKTYKVVADSYVMSWGGDCDVLAPKEECTEYNFNKDFLTCEYIRHLNEPIVINQTGRIHFVK